MPKLESLFAKKKKKPYWLYFLIIVGIAIVVVFSLDVEPIELTSKAVVIPITGEISSYGSSGFLAADTTSSQAVINQIRQANKDTAVKAIIFEINSPGGTVVGSKDISAEIEATTKPTVAWLREVAASGAYWVAASTDQIVADPATITGSIGVIGSFLEFSGFMEKYGITYEGITSGPYKDTGSPYKEATEEERLLLQKKINAIKDMFVKHISESRDMSINKVTGLATGEIFLGVEAYEKGLVDVLGGKNEALKAAEELAGEELTLSRYSTKTSLLEKLTQSMSSSAYFIGRGFGDSFKAEEELSLLAK